MRSTGSYSIQCEAETIAEMFGHGGAEMALTDLRRFGIEIIEAAAGGRVRRHGNPVEEIGRGQEQVGLLRTAINSHERLHSFLTSDLWPLSSDFQVHHVAIDPGAGDEQPAHLQVIAAGKSDQL